MGGAAFAHAEAVGEPTLKTPRMSPEQYNELKRIYLDKIQAYFPQDRVACLIEAPEKTDYGDMDLVVATNIAVDLVDLANNVGAVGIICRSNLQCSLAVRRDGTASNRPAVLYKAVTNINTDVAAGPSTSTVEEDYAQIDIEIVNPDLLEWHVFYSSYGDMIGLLGRIVTNLGFKISDRGFWLRLQELDDSKTVANAHIPENDGVIFLSKDPNKVMAFLNLSTEEYEASFNTLEELYEWLSHCRLICAEGIKLKRNTGTERQREQKRKVYTQFFNEWLPSHKDLVLRQDEEEQAQKLRDLRGNYLGEALEHFEKWVEFERKHTALVRQVRNMVATNLLRPLIAEHSGKKDKTLAEIMRAFRRHIGFLGSGKPTVLQTPHSDEEAQLYQFLAEDGQLLKDPAATSAWVAGNWERLRTLQRRTA